MFLPRRYELILCLLFMACVGFLLGMGIGRVRDDIDYPEAM